MCVVCCSLLFGCGVARCCFLFACVVCGVLIYCVVLSCLCRLLLILCRLLVVVCGCCVVCCYVVFLLFVVVC